VREVLERGGFLEFIGRDNVFATKADAIRAIYARLEADKCRVCTARIFEECASAPMDRSARIAAER
jgi:SulP family sulfate permease